MFRKLEAVFFLFLFSGLAYSEKYCLSDIRFESLGKTKPQYLLQTIPPLQTGHTFETLEDLENYLKEVNQNLENTRLLENITYKYEIEPVSENIKDVVAEYTFEDSTSLLILQKANTVIAAQISLLNLKLHLKTPIFLDSQLH